MKYQYLHGIRIVQDYMDAIKALKNGERITRFEFGESMSPILLSGEYAVITPIGEEMPKINIGNALFCNVNGIPMIHAVKDIDNEKGFLIGTTQGDILGYTTVLYGIAQSWKDFIGKRILNNSTEDDTI